MRIGSASALVLAAFALAACEGTPSTGSSASNATLAFCGLGCPDGDPTNDAPGTDPVNDTSDGDDSSTDGGNTTDLSAATSDITIALETSRLLKPTSGTSLSLLAAGTSPATTTDQILGPTKPTDITIRIDTNTGSNGSWPTPIQMPEYLTGTLAPDPTGGNNGGTNCAPDCGYREYRIFDDEVGQERDESLQVWAWTDSYATQYRNSSSSESPNHSWSFGGRKTALMPVTATPTTTYNGRFVATAKTSNWKKPADAIINPNALWRVQGASTLAANWGTASVAGTLTPQTWYSDQDDGEYRQVVSGPPMAPYTLVEAPYYSFYNTQVLLSGTITGNTYAGAANLDGPFLNGNQTMYGGFFGPGAAETTGIFHVSGADPYPIGGSAGINNDKRGYLNIQGAFNADCTPATCPP